MGVCINRTDAKAVAVRFKFYHAICNFRVASSERRAVLPVWDLFGLVFGACLGFGDWDLEVYGFAVVGCLPYGWAVI